MKRSMIFLATGALFLAACSAGNNSSNNEASADPVASQTSAQLTADNVEEALPQRLAKASSGDVITIPAGTFHFKRGLNLRQDGVTIKGAGMDKTVLSFKGMISGPQGLLVNGSDFTIQDLTIQDTMGDALKVKQGKNIIIRRVRTTWTGGPSTDNGAYGLYPIRITNLLVEDSEASGASDSGIYVGQSKNIIVRNNKATANVAGIEIENSIGADVYGNEVTGNTGGILVFNMPNLKQLGQGTRVYDNKVVKNNHANFGSEGTAVASVPAGSGIVINSNDDVEVFNNTIADNKTANVIIAAYFSTNYFSDEGVNPDYNPYPKGIYVHDNTFEGGGTDPDELLNLNLLKKQMFGADGHFPDVLWDGYFDPQDVDEDGLPPAEDRICVPNPDVHILNFDGPNDFANPHMQDAYFRCKLDPLPPVQLELAAADAS